jgi:hypothetical protein
MFLRGDIAVLASNCSYNDKTSSQASTGCADERKGQGAVEKSAHVVERLECNQFQYPRQNVVVPIGSDLHNQEKTKGYGRS